MQYIKSKASRFSPYYSIPRATIIRAGHTMIFVAAPQLVLFLQLTVQHFRPELLVLIGNPTTFPSLFRLRNQLAGLHLPVLVLSTSAENRINGGQFCPTCPPTSLTLIAARHFDELRIARNLSNFVATNRVVILSETPASPADLSKLFYIFVAFNVVLVEWDATAGELTVLAWKARLSYEPSRVSRFRGAAAIYRTDDDLNALAFRRELVRWTGHSPADCLIYMTPLAPLNFVVDHSKRQLLVSSWLTLLQLIGDHLHFVVKVSFAVPQGCVVCHEARPLRRNQAAQLFDHDSRVFYTTYGRMISLFRKRVIPFSRIYAGESPWIC